MLTKVLIIFFICLILYQAFLAYSSTILKREGLENEGIGDGSSCSSSVLAYKNSGAIQLLQDQVNKLMGLDKEVKDITGNVSTLNQQVSSLVNQQAQAATQLAGNKPVETSGLSSVP
jgi:peptidoglycan hydrolase CwlO-like protein